MFISRNFKQDQNHYEANVSDIIVKAPLSQSDIWIPAKNLQAEMDTSFDISH